MRFHDDIHEVVGHRHLTGQGDVRLAIAPKLKTRLQAVQGGVERHARLLKTGGFSQLYLEFAKVFYFVLRDFNGGPKWLAQA